MPVVDVHAHAVVPAALSEMATAHPDFGPELVVNDGRLRPIEPG